MPTSAYQPGNGKERLFFDIETAANPETCALMEPPVIEAPANYKDPVKIAEYKAEKTAASQAAALERAALDPDYGEIRSIGLSFGDEVTVVVNQNLYPKPENPNDEWLLPINACPEELMLNFFWNSLAYCGGRCVGYNILGFDLPFLMRRSMAHGIRPPVLPVLARYRTEPVTDLMQILFNWGGEKYKSLKQVAKIYRLPVECEGVNGSMVKDLTPEQLIAYQISDVKLVMALHARMDGIYFCHSRMPSDQWFRSAPQSPA